MGVMVFAIVLGSLPHHLPLTLRLTDLASSFFLGGYDLSFSFGKSSFQTSGLCGVFLRFPRPRVVTFLLSTGNPITDHEPSFCPPFRLLGHMKVA